MLAEFELFKDESMKNKIINSLPLKLKEALLVLFNKTRGRSTSVFEDDVYLTSYPKSGNTWVRFLVGYLIYKDALEGFYNIEEKMPDIYINKEHKLLKLPKPRVLKSHEYFEPRYRRVVYIVRDPRDVLVSYYFFHKKVGFIDKNYPISEYFERFIAGKLDCYGSWKENVGSWMGARGNSDNFLLVRYEDLLLDTESKLIQIANFIGISTCQKLISSAVEFGSFDNMKKLEREQSGSWLPIKNTTKTASFVRSAKPGNWTSFLPALLAKRMQDSWSDLMIELGYLN